MAECGAVYDEDGDLMDSKITGAHVASRQHIEEAFQECSSFLLTPSLQHTTIGDVSVFKDMPIKELNLAGCWKLTGEWVRMS